MSTAYSTTIGATSVIHTSTFSLLVNQCESIDPTHVGPTHVGPTHVDIPAEVGVGVGCGTLQNLATGLAARTTSGRREWYVVTFARNGGHCG